MLNRDQLTQLFEQVRQGTLPVDQAVDRLAGTKDLGFACVDTDRRNRCGFPEVIYGEGKTAEQIAGIMSAVVERDTICLATRLNAEQLRFLADRFPDLESDTTCGMAWLGQMPTNRQGRVTVVTAGTTDRPVAQEAVVTCQSLGCEVQLISDVGVAGLHRLLARIDEIRNSDCVVVVAGMEGALPSVVGGLVDGPVIAVPTSVGYGANFGGVSALLCMLTSCASNVAVVNIDAGFCGGFVAGLIARQKALA